VNKANYIIIEDDFLKEEPLIIRDIGPFHKYMTITNAAEKVVEELVSSGHLPPGRRLFYYDSENNLDELLIKDKKLAGFALIRDNRGNR